MGLIKTGEVKEKLDGQPNRISLELWNQLKPEQQQFKHLRSRTQKQLAKSHVQPVSLQDFLGETTQAPPVTSPPQDDNWASQFNWRGVKVPTLGDVVWIRGHM